MSKIIAVRAVGRERTEEEKLRRHLHGDIAPTIMCQNEIYVYEGIEDV